LVLDFVGIVQTHGPITAVVPPSKKGSGEGEAPTKVCPSCGEIVHLSVMVCPACGTKFELPQLHKLKLRDDDIMGMDAEIMSVTDWRWRVHLSKSSGREMIALDYYGDLSDPVVTEYFTIGYEGYAGQRAADALYSIAISSGVSVVRHKEELKEIAESLQLVNNPSIIKYKKDGRFFRVINREWEDV
jgi:DNA repair protein RadD